MYEGSEGTFDFDEDILEGIMAPRALKLIKEWATIHKGELEENCERADRNMP